MSSESLWRFLPVGFFLTVLMETPVLLVGLSKSHSLRRRLFAGVWLTACSYPTVVLVLPTLIDIDQHRTLYLVLAETFAPLSECLLFTLAFHRRRNLSRAHRLQDLLTITLANLFSFLFGDWLLQTAPGRQLLALVGW